MRRGNGSPCHDNRVRVISRVRPPFSASTRPQFSPIFTMDFPAHKSFHASNYNGFDFKCIINGFRRDDRNTCSAEKTCDNVNVAHATAGRGIHRATSSSRAPTPPWLDESAETSRTTSASTKSRLAPPHARPAGGSVSGQAPLLTTRRGKPARRVRVSGKTTNERAGSSPQKGTHAARSNLREARSGRTTTGRTTAVGSRPPSQRLSLVANEPDCASFAMEPRQSVSAAPQHSTAQRSAQPYPRSTAGKEQPPSRQEIRRSKLSFWTPDSFSRDRAAASEKDVPGVAAVANDV